eukprot:743462_1
MASKKATSPPPPHQHFSPPPYDIVHNKLNEVKEDTENKFKEEVKDNPNIDETSLVSDKEEAFVKKKLLYHLQTRPERQRLVNLNILRAFDADPSLRAVMDNLMKQRLRMLLSSRILDKKLSNRKSIQSLIREGILKEADDGSDEEEEEQKGNRRDMYRRMSNHSLTEFLSRRPTLQELVKADDGSDEEEEEQKGNRRDMYRRMSNHSLTEFLSRRPTLQELVKANMVQDVMTWTHVTCTG